MKDQLPAYLGSELSEFSGYDFLKKVKSSSFW